MQRSNTYVLVFTVILTIVIGGVLSFTSQLLAPAQKKSIELDTKTSILNAVVQLKEEDNILEIYNERIKSIVVNYQGNIIKKDKKGNPIIAENINILKNYKKPKDTREYPVYIYMDKHNNTKVEAYIFPLYGAGLWNAIYGYIALKNDLNTIKGASFGHVQETPGLGARIDSREIQKRYENKTIFNENSTLVSVIMQKGEKRDPSLFGAHEVDGMSGATLTAKGLNAMLKDYLLCYESFIKKNQYQ